MIQIETERADIEILISAAWAIAYTGLWNGEEFTELEILIAKKIISYYISNVPEPYEEYLMFCQRVLMARQYLINNPDKYVPIPSEWFSPANLNGYVGTAKWYERLQTMRKSQPLFKHQIKALPEAVLEMTEEPTAANFHYWRSWFAERGYNATLNLFLSVMANSIWY